MNLSQLNFHFILIKIIFIYQDHVDFANQERIYNDLGKEVVDAAFTGYNACIFAYGNFIAIKLLHCKLI